MGRRILLAKPTFNLHFIILGENQWMIDPDTLCEFTGLYDKNKNMIYEHDICTCPYIDPIFLSIWNEENSEYCEIIFIQGAYAVKYVDKTNLLLNNLSEKIEVIGNIFDNPELLEAK